MNEDYITNWTKEEFLAYILLYSAQADYVETEEEKSMIISKVGSDAFQKIHDELENDNDYASIQKIMNNVERFDYSQDQLEDIIKEMRSLFLSDGHFDQVEQNLFIGLKRLFHG